MIGIGLTLTGATHPYANISADIQCGTKIIGLNFKMSYFGQ